MVGIVGANGAGKTTLLKIVTGQEKADSGSLRLGDTVKFAYADQLREGLDPDKSVWEQLSGGLDLMLEELLGNIQELSAGSSDVIGAVEKVAELTRGTESAVREARENIGKSSEGIEAVADIALKVRADALDMTCSHCR